MVDLEEEFHAEELTKLVRDVQQKGLGLMVFADWYNAEAMGKMGFYDDNTRSWWTPATGVWWMGVYHTQTHAYNHVCIINTNQLFVP